MYQVTPSICAAPGAPCARVCVAVTARSRTASSSVRLIVGLRVRTRIPAPTTMPPLDAARKRRHVGGDSGRYWHGWLGVRTRRAVSLQCDDGLDADRQPASDPSRLEAEY